MPQQRQQTQRFDLKLQVPAFLAQENVCMVFSSILDEAQTRLAIYELKQSSFSYDVPGEGNFAEISRYLHSSLSKLGFLMAACQRLVHFMHSSCILAIKACSLTGDSDFGSVTSVWTWNRGDANDLTYKQRHKDVKIFSEW